MKVKKRERRRKMKQAFGLLQQGCTLKEAGQAVGVHASTVWRWVQRLPEAEQERILPAPPPPSPRPTPRVPMRMDCPACGGQLGWRTGWSSNYLLALRQFCKQVPRFRFLVCKRCGFTSWRPLAPGQCARCQGYLVWTRSRLRKVCARGCGG
ncbi:MAG: helix-turn-helix domain-containing protein [Armatimonadota bacterium]